MAPLKLKGYTGPYSADEALFDELLRSLSTPEAEAHAEKCRVNGFRVSLMSHMPPIVSNPGDEGHEEAIIRYFTPQGMEQQAHEAICEGNPTFLIWAFTVDGVVKQAHYRHAMAREAMIAEMGESSAD